ncbi:MAG: hypothetical protein EPO63_05680 [Candidatus Nitrosotenuis sp.]|nr:MAG: hypothetical protein EPO63_05680 [Candidatus Nitrosotenuis sp.]
MGITTVSQYVQFYVGLDMQDSIGLLSFVNNEKLVLKSKLENKKLEKESILHGIKLLDELTSEIHNLGESAVLEKYAKSK